MSFTLFMVPNCHNCHLNFDPSTDCALASAALDLRFRPDPPTLSSYGVHRLNKSDSLELTCRYVQCPVAGMYPVHSAHLYMFLFRRGRQFLQWTTPRTSARLSTSDCRGSGLFCTTLRISNATVNETGLYQCSYKDLKAEDGKTAVAAYVFVRGKSRYLLHHDLRLWWPLGYSNEITPRMWPTNIQSAQNSQKNSLESDFSLI